MLAKNMAGKAAVVVGVGTVGCFSSELLVRAGVGRLVIVDRDIVEASNIDHQVLYGSGDIGQAKAVVARERLIKASSKTKIISRILDLDNSNISVIAGADIILDCTDNLEARFLMNDFCMENGISWVHSAAIGDLGNVVGFSPGTPCFGCIFKEAHSLESCDTLGVSLPVAAAVAAFQVNEALGVLEGSFSSQRFIRINMREGSVDCISARKNKTCNPCNGNYEYLSGKRGSRVIRMCGSDSFQIKGSPVDLAALKKKISGKNIKDFGYCISMPGFTLFSDGRALVRASSESQARSRYSRLLG